jgi:hypothetical protein
LGEEGEDAAPSEAEEEEEDADQASHPSTLRTLEEKCLAFFLARLGHKPQRHEYESPLIRVLAVIGLDSNSSWKHPGVFTSTLSNIIKLARYFVVQGAYQSLPAKDRTLGPAVEEVA